ncbi:MAG: hypothetical protein ACRD0P_23850 [Stackebrandtia sp.]
MRAALISLGLNSKGSPDRRRLASTSNSTKRWGNRPVPARSTRSESAPAEPALAKAS